jgi:hypothetical protein
MTAGSTLIVCNYRLVPVWRIFLRANCVQGPANTGFADFTQILQILQICGSAQCSLRLKLTLHLRTHDSNAIANYGNHRRR